MRIRFQGIWFVVSASAGFFLLVAAVAGLVLLPAADRADREDMRLRLLRLESRLDQQVERVRSLTQDYGSWSDTLEFVQGERPQYVEVNLQNDRLDFLRMDLVAIFDRKGELRAGRARSGVSGPSRVLAANELAELAARVSAPAVGEVTRGVVRVPEGVLLFSASAITNEDYSAPSAGVLIVGQYLTGELLGELTAGENHRAWLEQGPANGVDFALAGSGEMKGWMTLRMENGMPTGRVEVVAPRASRLMLTRSLRLVFGAQALATLIFALLTWVFVERRFLRRIESLTRQVGRLETDAEARATLAAEQGGDEVSQLGRATGEMAEKLAQSREAAERAMRAKGDFLAAMSHEIRTPLNGVIGYIGLLRETALSRQQEEHVRVIESSGETLLGVINEILDFSKIEAGQVELESIPTDVGGITREVMALFLPKLRGKALEGEVRVGARVPARLMADPLRYRQVLTNLVANAVKFTASGGVRVGVEPLEGSSGVRVTVRDTGIGMTPEQLAVLFQPFTQADSSTTRRYGGTGLGLAISRRLVRAWGGELTVSSEVGHGSCFVFTLPAAVAATPIVEESAGTVRDGGSESGFALAEKCPLKILMAEDNAVNARLLAAILKRHGYEAEHVTDGRAAVEAMARTEFDLVLMDVQMPEMDGLEAVRRQRARERELGLSRVLVAALTANAQSGAREECLEAGMDDYLAKPFQVTQVRSLLERAAARKLRAKA